MGLVTELMAFIGVFLMAKSGMKPGTNTGTGGGIFQEQGPKGGKHPNYVTVPDHKPLPPNSRPGHTWVPTHVTPNSKR